MKIWALVVFAIVWLGGCYKGNPPCRPGTVDYPRCNDVTQPKFQKKAK